MSAAPRTALIVHADAPQLPFIATALGTRFTALARNGWSVVLLSLIHILTLPTILLV